MNTEVERSPSSFSSKIIEATDVRKVFHSSVQDVIAVTDVSFSAKPGEFVSLVGPSGCGKSTLLRLIAGLVPKTSGSLVLHGKEVSQPRSDVGILFQSPVLLPWKTVEDNVLLPRKIQGTCNGTTRQEARDLLAMVGLEGFVDAYPFHLSGGMQQRVALARLLMTGAKTLLLDEPFAALDEFTRERLNLELMRICSEFSASVLFVTHNIQEAVFLGDRVLVMTPRPGKLAGTVEVDLPRPREISLLRAPEFVDLTFAVRDVLNVEHPREG